MENRMGLQRLLTQLKTEDWLGRHIDAYQEKESPEEWRTPSVDIHPSSSGSPCPRDIELGMLGYRTPIAPKNRRRMDNGTYAHTRWENYFKEMGLLHSCEVNVQSVDPYFNGTCDVILKHPVTGKLHIGEIKTMNSNRWRRVPDQYPDKTLMMRQLMATERPYVYQLTMYRVMIPKVLGLPIDEEVIFIFENTDTQEFKIRYGIPDERLQKEAFNNPVEAQKAALEGRLLDPPYRRGSPTCENCYKKLLCYKAQDDDPETLEKIHEALLKVRTG